VSAARRPRKRERQERILAELHADPAVRIGALAQTFAVSSETVRRDLDELIRDGRVNRTYGGAALPPMGVEPSLNERYRRLVAERARIGRLAATLVAPGEVPMIDAGSTTAHRRRLAAELGDPTVVINGLVWRRSSAPIRDPRHPAPAPTTRGRGIGTGDDGFPSLTPTRR
jgi:DeoR/GlpR family transcriptional regulator of sugar metabolism